MTRCEGAINYAWGEGAPVGGVGPDNFSVRWTGRHAFAAGSTTFTAVTDDGMRVWLDGIPLIDAWRDQAPTTYTATPTLTAGEHEVRVEFYDATSHAAARLSW